MSRPPRTIKDAAAELGVRRESVSDWLKRNGFEPPRLPGSPAGVAIDEKTMKALRKAFPPVREAAGSTA